MSNDSEFHFDDDTSFKENETFSDFFTKELLKENNNNSTENKIVGQKVIKPTRERNKVKQYLELSRLKREVYDIPVEIKKIIDKLEEKSKNK